MAWDRQTRGLSQRKQEKPQIKKHHPLKSEGNDGSISIRSLSDGVFLFFKALGSWFKVFNNKSHMIPDKPNVYDIGSPNKPWRSGYFSSNSLHIGSNLSNRITVGLGGEGDNVQLKLSNPDTGNIVADNNQSIQTVTGTVVLSDTSVSAFSVGTTTISGDGDLTISDGIDFIVIGDVNFGPLQTSIQTNLDNIENNTKEIDNLQNYTSRTQAYVDTLQTQNEQILNSIESLSTAHNRLRNLIVQNQNNFIEASSAINNDNYTKYEDAQ